MCLDRRMSYFVLQVKPREAIMPWDDNFKPTYTLSFGVKSSNLLCVRPLKKPTETVTYNNVEVGWSSYIFFDLVIVPSASLMVSIRRQLCCASKE